MNEPVKLKIYPVYGNYNGERVIVGSRESCGSCGGYIPNGEGRDKCPHCRAPFTEE